MDSLFLGSFFCRRRTVWRRQSPSHPRDRSTWLRESLSLIEFVECCYFSLLCWNLVPHLFNDFLHGMQCYMFYLPRRMTMIYVTFFLSIFHHASLYAGYCCAINHKDFVLGMWLIAFFCFLARKLIKHRHSFICLDLMAYECIIMRFWTYKINKQQDCESVVYTWTIC